jgi:hypothetical protein
MSRLFTCMTTTYRTWSLILAVSALASLAAGEVEVRADGAIRIDGRGFFPIGTYQVGWSSTAAQLKAGVQAAAADGFNLVHASRSDSNDFPGLCDTAQASGVRLIVEGIPFANPGPVIATLAAKPAIIAWNVGDDVHTNTTVDELRARNDRFRQADPQRPTYVTVFDQRVMGPYLGIAGLVGPYYYPVPAEPVSLVHAIVSAARQAQPGVLHVPQSFAWPGSRDPTALEYRSMLWLGLIAGAKGVMGYAHFDGSFRLSDHPTLYAEVVRTNRDELPRVAMAICDGQRQSLATGSADVVASRWAWHGSWLVAVANMAAGARDVALPLIGAPAASPVALFPGQPDALSLAGGQLTGRIGAQQTMVYRLGALANGAPVCSTAALTVDSGGSVAFTLGSDPDGDPVTWTVGQPGHGTLSGSGDSRTYTPDPGFAGTDQCTVTGHDGWADAVQVTRSITVVANAAPQVDAGPDMTITLPASASLNGSANDDGLPTGSMLSYAWTTVSGPGAVTFASSHSSATQVDFPSAGTYVLRLTASDGASAGADIVTITVNTEPSHTVEVIVDGGNAGNGCGGGGAIGLVLALLTLAGLHRRRRQ